MGARNLESQIGDRIIIKIIVIATFLLLLNLSNWLVCYVGNLAF